MAVKSLVDHSKSGNISIIGFVGVGAIFLAVIVQYFFLLNEIESKSRAIQEQADLSKSLMMEISHNLYRIREAEWLFSTRKEWDNADQVLQAVEKLINRLNKLGELDSGIDQGIHLIVELLQSYKKSFSQLAESWRKMGLSYDIGLQGSLRKAARRMESFMPRKKPAFKNSVLEWHILRLRRHEKD
ncbi:hypothetical protein, partial [Candidatus Magnetaquicoccus inordinatus]|uniref:hypothetical protein n=1 Tax=Candidatus Magnetaquicoccus inordinatus TaxID=2496818 RepID=UPI00187D2851